MAVLSDTKHHVVIGEETFPAAFRNQRLWYSGKVSWPIVWLSATFDCHALPMVEFRLSYQILKWMEYRALEMNHYEPFF